ncbi:MAG TPA: cyclase family protein [Promineifilum sp.]|nr:cyclase family protein [Promineifilum sp.]
MSIRFHDITRTMFAGMSVWPGDAPFELEPTAGIAEGSTVNLTRLSMSAHTGTHVDAPYHFTDDGATMEQVDPAIYWGSAQVVTVKKATGPLVPADFAGYDLGLAPRLLVHSGASAADPRIFPQEFAYPSPKLADYLGALGIILYGTDAPSVDASDSQTLDGHHALRRNNIAILEGLDLTDVPDGIYELAAIPLKILGGDGSPVRAILRTTGANE